MLLPAGQVDAVVKRPEPPVRLGHVGPPGKPGAAGGQFLDAEVAEVALGALGFEAEVALARAAPAAAGDDLAVDGQPDDAVLTLDAVVVPLAGGLAAALAGQAAHPALGVWSVRLQAGPLDGEDVAVAGVIVGVEAVEDLDLDPAGEGGAGGRQGVAPDEQARVALFLEVLPLHFEDEVLVHLCGAQEAERDAGGDDHPVARGEGFGAAGDGDPALEVL